MSETFTLRNILEAAIKESGGWVNAHAHADRAFTLNAETLEVYRTCTLEQKWDVLDRIKRNSTEEDYYARFAKTIELMIGQGVTAMGTFVDIDPAAGDRAIKAAIRAREHYKNDITVKFAVK